MTDRFATPQQVRTAVCRISGRLPLHTSRTRLRRVTPQDAPAVRAYRSLPEVTLYLGHLPLTEAGARELVDGWLADAGSLHVVVEVEDSVVGDVALGFRPCAAKAPATTNEVEARLGYAVHPAWQGRGLATESVRALVGLVFEAGGARRVTTRVFSPASASTSLLGRLGFVREGVERQAVLAPDGSRWWDDEWWSLLAEEWQC